MTIGPLSMDSPTTPEWMKAIVKIAGIIHDLPQGDRVKVMDEAFCEFCPICGFNITYEESCTCEDVF